MKSDSSSIATRQVILVTGAARSGKSEWAENLAHNSSKSVVYVATAIMTSEDREWQKRILKHQQRRPSNWITIAEPKNLTRVINQAKPDQCLLIDSLGTWVANLLDVKANNWDTITNNLLFSLTQTQSQLIFVGEETGWGVIPAYASGRLFRDRLGHIIRQIGTVADTAYLVTGGHALNLSVLGTALDRMRDEEVIE
ncbi:Adenosyl cobinamide kinase/adenosyl cobinamide phosphate guanylyltransferase [Hyella patelloides LEGE 07179]|uniref:Adenosylcobinamide kinase n=1 Tax=Hyella patelloides LEGE 07179 TaxID=945734 RepID=A0A563VIR8_9CYAN|nr:bifunctional adenosylcobinamide kinase/adenosylcobinamide-phosphate guanylyltransferase [Hyella patelloides]VEP11281.1 Adenosyl cobinamide kinase/adenosyl cobinamide phosphate guanylyltransferase [Hyella patelloides LEGE 07179]